jgi:hypothetical protein
VHTIVSQSAMQHEKKVHKIQNLDFSKKRKKRNLKKKQLNTKVENQHYIDILHNIF